ncbi:zinc finger MYM-type protein 1-like [Stigmatopora argus]
MPHCSAIGCTNRTDGKHNPPDLSFHSFPMRDRDLLTKWLHNVGRETFSPTKASRVCSAHFLPDCFKVDVYEKYGLESTERGRRKRRLLANHAVPTEFGHRSAQQMRALSVSQMEKQERKRQIKQVYPPEDPKKIRVENVTGEAAELDNEEMSEELEYLFIEHIGLIEIQRPRHTLQVESVPEHQGGSPHQVNKDHAYATSKLISFSGPQHLPSTSDTNMSDDSERQHLHSADAYTSKHDLYPDSEEPESPYLKGNDEIKQEEEPESPYVKGKDEIKQEEEPYISLEEPQHLQPGEEPELHQVNGEEELQPTRIKEEAVPEPPITSHIKVEDPELDTTKFPLTFILKTEREEDDSDGRAVPANCTSSPDDAATQTSRAISTESRAATSGGETFTDVARTSGVDEALEVHVEENGILGNLDNSVKSLMTTPFDKRTLAQKLQVKERGPHQPDLNLTIQQSKDIFSRTWYSRKAWLTGCSESKAFFCFPCLLFQTSHLNPVWVKTGMTDLNRFVQEVKNHEVTSTHVENALRLAVFGEVSVERQLAEGYRLEIRKVNQAVDKKRQVLSGIIERIKRCDAFELALHDQDQSGSFENPAVFRVLVDFAAALETDLREILQDTAFRGNSKRLQNELLGCMSLVLRERVVDEINSADYVAIQVDQTVDISARCHLALVLRYIDPSHHVRERLFELTPLRQDADDSIAGTLLDHLNVVLPALQKKKLISQSHGGWMAANDATGSVPKKIVDSYKNARYIHCYVHRLDDIIQQATSVNPRLAHFFSDLARFSTFFSTLPKRLAELDKAAARRISGVAKIKWNFQSQAVLTDSQHREHLRRFLETITDSGEFDSGTVRDASGLLRLLEDGTFIFFLRLFHLIAPHVKILDGLLQEPAIDAVVVKDAMKNFADGIQATRDSLPSLCKEHSCSGPPLTNTQDTRGPCDRQIVATKVCDTILKVAKDRFAFTTHLISATLLLGDRFEDYRSKFPETALNSTANAYPLLNKSKLKVELVVIYGNDDFGKCKSLVALYQLLTRNRLQDTFSETLALLKILLTIPITTTESDRRFPTLKKIKTFLGNAVSHDRLSAIAVIAMEKNLIKSIPDFNHRVIEKFSSLEGRSEIFAYKR